MAYVHLILTGILLGHLSYAATLTQGLCHLNPDEAKPKAFFDMNKLEGTWYQYGVHSTAQGRGRLPCTTYRFTQPIPGDINLKVTEVVKRNEYSRKAKLYPELNAIFVTEAVRRESAESSQEDNESKGIFAVIDTDYDCWVVTYWCEHNKPSDSDAVTNMSVFLKNKSKKCLEGKSKKSYENIMAHFTDFYSNNMKWNDVDHCKVPEGENTAEKKATEQPEKKVTEQPEKKVTELPEKNQKQPEQPEKKVTEQLEKKVTGQPEKKVTEQLEKNQKQPEQPEKKVTEQLEKKVTEQPEKKVTEQLEKNQKQPEQPEKKVTELPEKKATEQPEKKVTEQPEKKVTEQLEKNQKQPEQPEKKVTELPEKKATEQPEEKVTEQPEKKVTEQLEKNQKQPEQPEKKVAEQPEKKVTEQPEKNQKQPEQPEAEPKAEAETKP